MSLIGKLIARLHAVLDQTGNASASVHTARERLAQASGKVAEASAGSSSELPREGLAKWQAADVKLEEALHCFRAGDEAMRGYIALLSNGSGATTSVAADQSAAASAPEPPRFETPGYPFHKRHTIGWSDLHHVLHGDPDDERKGGHLYGTGRPNKTEFPKDWDDEDIRKALGEIADNPLRVEPKRGGNFFATGEHRGISVTAVVRPDGSIAAGWPLPGAGVTCNPPRRG